MTVKKRDFLLNYFTKQNISQEIQKEFLKKDSSNDEITIFSDNTIEMILTLDLNLPSDIFDIDFRNNLIKWLRKKYEFRAYYIFFLEKIDYESIEKNELPYIVKVGSDYNMRLPVKCTLITFKKDDIISMKLVLTSDNIETKINIYAVNKYLSCKLILNVNQILDTNYSLLDKVYNKSYKNNDDINVKIIQFFNNKLEEGFTSKINCSGEISNY